MKKTISIILGLMAFSGVAYAQTQGGISVPQGGTGLSAIPAGYFVTGSTTLHTDAILAVPLASTTGTLTVSHGGTGAATLTGLLLGSGTSAITTVTAPSGTVVGTSDSQTLTNKVINASNNTVTNVSLTTGVTGNLPVGNLNSGSGASGSTFWRGDGAWATPAGSGGGVGWASTTADTNSLLFTGTHFVGIGTTSPWAVLSVSSTSQNIGTLPLFVVASTTNAELFRVNGNGNVGIASSSPENTLSVGGTISATTFSAYNPNSTNIAGLIVNNGSVNQAAIKFRGQSSTSGIYADANNDYFQIGGGIVSFSNSGSITAGANLNGINVFVTSGSVGSPSVNLGGNFLNGLFRTGSNDVQVSAGGINVAGFYNTGNVGVGSTNPGAAFTVAKGDVYVGTTTGNISGVITEASDQSCHRIVVSNTNVITASTVTCPSF